MDRFSELTDFIMHHIMSYLSAKEVARTGILSKRWKGLSASFPIFDFHESYIHFMGNDLAFNNLDPTSAYYRKPIQRFLKLVPKFINFVDASLSRFSDLNLCMQKFKLMICVIVDIQRMASVVEKWIRSAVECGVKELDFHAKTDTEVAVIYTLPQILFSAESMNTIKLRGCKLELPSKNIIRLHSLKSLTLKEVCIQEETIQKLTGQCCPLLEDLSLRECWGFKRIYITEAYKLKTIKIRALVELGTISIDVPSLQVFKLGYIGLQGSIAIDMVGCPNLAVLKLSCITFTHQEFHLLISNFPLLEFLDLNVCDILERISISSNTLKILSINLCYKLKAIDIDTPNLVSFIYTDNPIPDFSINAPCPWNVELENTEIENIRDRRITFDLDTRWFLKMKKFLQVSNQIEFLTLHIISAKNTFSFEKFIQSSASLPCEVGTLYLQIDGPRSNYEAMLDGVFAVCNPRTLSIIKNQETDNDFIEWLYEKLMNKNSNCCKSHRVKNWRYYIKDFKIEGFFPYRYSKCSESFHDIDNLKDVWPQLQPQSGELQIRLDCCFLLTIEEA